MRRTESRDALQGQVCVAAFVWDVDEDGPIPLGRSWLRGAVPEDHIAFGGYLHVTKRVSREEGGPQDCTFTIAGRKAFFANPLEVGWYPIRWEPQTPSTFSRVDTEFESRLQLDFADSFITGQFCIYIYYIYAECRFPDLEGPLAEDFLMFDDGALFVRQDDGSSKIRLDIA